MSMTRIDVPVIGVDLYCPDCHRLLVHVNDDGALDISGRTEVSAALTVDLVQADESEATLLDATCMLRICRLKRWLRR